MLLNRAVCSGIGAIGSKRQRRNDERPIHIVGPVEQMDFPEIAGGPRRQFLEALELAFVLPPPPRRIGRLVRSLEFDKSPCRRPHSLQGNIRPTDPGIAIFGLDDQPLGY